MSVPMFGQGMKDKIGAAIADGPDIIRRDGHHSSKSVEACAQRRTRNNAPARSVPVQDQCLPGISAIVDCVTDGPYVVRTASRYSGEMVIGAANAWARNGSPTESVPMLNEGLLIAYCLIINVAHGPCIGSRNRGDSVKTLSHTRNVLRGNNCPHPVGCGRIPSRAGSLRVERSKPSDREEKNPTNG